MGCTSRTLAAWLLFAVFSSGPVAARPVGEDAVLPAGDLVVGALNLHPCPHAAAYCGVLQRPLDPSGRVAGELPIAFQFYPHRDAARPAAGTIVAQEGGPGFPTIASRAGYLALFAPLRGDHDMLLVDARGTGASGAIDCRWLQTEKLQTLPAVTACGESLGGAAVLYGTGLAVEDMVAVLDALRIGRIDFYGDSYGTFFGQTFAARYPDRLRSLVLDGAYPVIGETPWYSNAGVVVRRGFDLACQRAPYCKALGGSYYGRIVALLDRLRRAPVSGNAPDADGRRRPVTADPATLGLALYAGVSGPVIYRDLDAAARALQDNDDPAPLLRLMAENLETEAPGPAQSYSRGLFAAVSCMDYQQIYDMSAPPDLRQRQRNAAIAAEQRSDPEVYPPLSIDEFLTVPLDISVLDLCLGWPVVHPPYPPGVPIPPGARFTDAPTLVLNGELDMLTTAAEGAITAAQFPHARQIVLANSFHVDAVGDVDDCAQAIVRRFVSDLDPGEVSCAARINPVRLVPFFPRHAAEAIAADPRPGNSATSRERALASAAVQSAGDVLARWYVNTSGRDTGLHGGDWSYTQPGDVVHFRLRQVRWTEDLAVSGEISWDQLSGAIAADLRFAATGGASGRIAARWNDQQTLAKADLEGQIGTHTLLAEMPAP